MITIQHKELVEKTKEAYEFKPGELFYDSMGDIFLRLEDGCLMFTNNGDPVDLVQSFPEEDLTEYDNFSYLKDCTKAAGKVSITITLE